jgi:hypothetical protein
MTLSGETPPYLYFFASKNKRLYPIFKRGDFYLCPFSLCITNLQFFKQEYYLIRGVAHQRVFLKLVILQFSLEGAA